MNDAVFTSGEAQKAADHASPHGHDADGKVVAIPWYNDDKQIRASGSIKASVRDLSQWLRSNWLTASSMARSSVSADALERRIRRRFPCR